MVDPALFLSCSRGEKGLRQGHFKSVTGASEITRAAFVDNDSDSVAEKEECGIEDWEEHLYDDSEIKVEDSKTQRKRRRKVKMSDGSFEDDSGDDCDDIESGSEDEDTSEIVVPFPSSSSPSSSSSSSSSSISSLRT